MKTSEIEINTESDQKPTLTVIEETDGYAGQNTAVGADAVRIGRGVGPSVVVTAPGDPVAMTSIRYGFPMTVGAYIPDNRLLAAYVHEHPGESRWCGVPLQKGSVVVYPPGTEHFAIAHPGLRLSYVLADPEPLMTLADRYGISAEIPEARRLLEIPASPATSRMGRVLDGLTCAAAAGEQLEKYTEPVLAAVAGVLEGRPSAMSREPSTKLDSRTIVRACIDYAEATQCAPSLGELCAAAHVSERRLRSAFTEEFDLPPTAFFRTWALDRVHHRLRAAEPTQESVTAIAADLGFEHYGRFAGYYRDVYGEKPSETLRCAAS